MIPFVGLLEDVLDADAVMEDIQDLIFGRVCCCIQCSDKSSGQLLR